MAELGCLLWGGREGVAEAPGTLYSYPGDLAWLPSWTLVLPILESCLFPGVCVWFLHPSAVVSS